MEIVEPSRKFSIVSHLPVSAKATKVFLDSEERIETHRQHSQRKRHSQQIVIAIETSRIEPYASPGAIDVSGSRKKNPVATVLVIKTALRM